MSKQYANLDNAKNNEINIVCLKRDTFSLDIDIEENGSPFDFTTKHGKMEIKNNGRGDVHECILEFNTDNNTIIFNGNTVQLRQNSADMDIQAADYSYDMQVVDTVSGEVLTLFGGLFNVNQDITN